VAPSDLAGSLVDRARNACPIPPSPFHRPLNGTGARLASVIFLALCRLAGKPGVLVAQAELTDAKSCDMLRQHGEDNVMSQGNTVRLHRVFATGPEKVFRAFLDAEAMAKWLPPYGFTCKVHHFEAKVGGTFRMSFSNFTTNTGHSFGGEYLEIVPNERIRYTDRFDDPNLPGVIEVTVTLKAVSCGTEVNIEQANLPTVIPVESCYLGWQQSLAQLALLVEPDIPG
jgi:uncharacterized protein YndB with AHSA1/START domain